VGPLARAQVIVSESEKAKAGDDVYSRPEEVYLVLSPGRFQHGESGWFEPGIGGTLYNEPNIRHAMVSDGAPLLALWHLWTGWL
jgi:hypothetical protein